MPNLKVTAEDIPDDWYPSTSRIPIKAVSGGTTTVESPASGTYFPTEGAGLIPAFDWVGRRYFFGTNGTGRRARMNCTFIRWMI